MIELYPSLISAHLLGLREEIDLLEPYVAGFHIDVMDFHFVPNLTWGPIFVNQIRKATSKKLFIHLMVDEPSRYLDRLEIYEEDIVSIHFESCGLHQIRDVLYELRSRGWVPSIALNPETSLSTLELLDSSFDNVLLMSVEPGFSGQTFIEGTFDKLKALDVLRSQGKRSFSIAVDGGITPEISRQLSLLGANQVAVASALFNFEDRISAVKKFIKNS